jgi:hypothetical protein
VLLVLLLLLVVIGLPAFFLWGPHGSTAAAPGTARLAAQTTDNTPLPVAAVGVLPAAALLGLLLLVRQGARRPRVAARLPVRSSDEPVVAHADAPRSPC